MTTENSSQTSDTTASAAATTSSDSTPSAAPASQPAPASASAAATPASGVADAQPAAPAPFQPNFKFKAFGKEHEIEDTFRSLIKDKDTEEKVRKFHEKAYAMEKFQEDSKKFKGDFESYKAQTEPNLKAMNHFNNLLKNKDWDNFFGGLQVPKEEIFDWVRKQLELESMDPRQRSEIERANQIRQQNYAYEQQMQEQTQSFQQLSVQTRQMQLDSLMARQDISSQAEKVDQAYGRIGAFRDLVIEEAANHWHRTQQDLPADAAVQLALKKFGVFLSPQGAVTSPAQAAAPSAPAGNAAPIIPHVAGSGRSPVKKSPRSLDDLRAIAKQLTS